MAQVSVEEAKEVHQRVLVFDGHNDTPVERVARKEAPLKWMARDAAYHTDVPRMREGGYDGGVFITGNGAVADVMITSERVLTQIEAHPDVFKLVLSSKDVEVAKQSGQIAVLMGIEGAGRWLKGDLDMVRLLYRLGIRLLGITHGEGSEDEGMLQGSRSPFGPCTMEEREAERKNASGLTDFGRQVLQLSNELGLLTDLAHINDKAFFEVLELSQKPVVMSHTAVCALCPHWRCMTDDQIRAMAAAGGVMGIAFAPMFIHPEEGEATAERVAAHVRYVADLVGVDHVGIGTDFDGLGRTVPVIPEVSQLPLLTRELLAAGFSEEEVNKVWGGNFLRVLRKTIDG